MKDLPYAIIVDGEGKVTERKLADHGPGTVLAPSISVVSNTVVDNVRTVVMSRPVQGASKDHYTFQTLPGDLSIISAVGNSAQLSYHKSRTGGTITLLPTRDQVGSTFYLLKVIILTTTRLVCAQLWKLIT